MPRARIITAALLLPIVITAARPARLSAQSPRAGLANVQVSHGRYQAYGEPYLAVNPRNPHNLLGAAQCINGSALPLPCTFASLDDGRTWHENGPLPLPAGDRGGGDVTVAFSSQGTGFVASHTGAGWNVDSVLVWRTSDGGHSFDPPTVVFPGSGGAVVVDHPWLAAGPAHGQAADTLYIAWTATPGQDFARSRLLFSRSTDGGRHFDPPRTLVHMPHGFPGIPVVTVGPAGTVHVVFAVGGQRNPACNCVSPYALPGVPMPRMVVSSSDGGRHFGPPHPIAVEPGFGLTTSSLNMANIAAAATDPVDGSLYVAMLAYRPGTRHTDVLLWRSLNGGRTWAEPMRVNDDPLSDQADHFQPQIAVTAHGTVYVSYFALVRGRVDVYLAWSTTHGARFWPSERITTVSFDPRRSGQQREGPWIGDYQGLAIGARAIYPFWNDTRTGHMELFTAVVGIVCC